MPRIIKNHFDSYKFWYYSSFSYEALIYLYKAGELVGRIVFIKDSEELPENGMASPFGTPVPSIHLHVSRFNDVVNILREEKPLHLFLNIDHKIGILATDDFEPVGEEEGA